MCLKLKLSVFGDDSPDSGSKGLLSKFAIAKHFLKRKTNKKKEEDEADKTPTNEKPKVKNANGFKSKISNFFNRKNKKDTLPYTKGENVEMSGVANPTFKETNVNETERETEAVLPETLLTPIQESARNLNTAISLDGGLNFMN